MISNSLKNIPIRFKRQILGGFYIFDCISYIIVFFSLFLFISYLSSDSVGSEIEFFNILILFITTVQCLRPFAMLAVQETELLIRDIALAIVFGSVYFFFYQISSITHGDITSLPLIFKLRVTIEIFFYTIYVLFTFSRVSPFLRSIKMDFLYSFTFGFIFLIFFGTWLLSLPISRTAEIPLLDLLFTATSSVTVTGLLTIDFTRDLTVYGHLIVLGLVQIGGLGILTFSTLYMLNLKDSLSFEERMYTAGLFATNTTQDINKLLKWIVLFTLSVEIIGAIFLYIGTLNLSMSQTNRVFFAIFHSVASFCNAGISIVTDSMRYFFDNPFILYTISILVIFGGLGFVTLLELRKKFFSFAFQKDRKSIRKVPLSGQTKVILTLTAIFLLFGTAYIFLVEQNHSLEKMTLWQKVNNSFFTSVNLRTSGFQTIGITHLENSTIWMFMAFMFIGTAPNSTGGGIKLTTFFVLVWALVRVASHKTKNEQPVMGFNFSSSLVAHAGSILFLRLLVIFLAVAILATYEQAPLITLIFEVVSAFSTVGLSQNLTPTLSYPSKIVLILLMFVGRVGSFYILSNILPFKGKKSSVVRKKQTFSLE